MHGTVILGPPSSGWLARALILANRSPEKYVYIINKAARSAQVRDLTRLNWCDPVRCKDQEHRLIASDSSDKKSAQARRGRMDAVVSMLSRGATLGE